MSDGIIAAPALLLMQNKRGSWTLTGEIITQDPQFD
jgi:hypothetical protein